MPYSDAETGEIMLDAPSLVEAVGDQLAESFDLDPSQLGYEHAVQDVILLVLGSAGLVGYTGAASELGVTRQRFRQLTEESSSVTPTPEPVITAEGRWFWLREEITRFKAARQPVKDAQARKLTETRD